MCTVAPDVMDKLEVTVKDYLNKGQAFSGYDVTLETREREKIKLRHQDCRGAVHEIQSLKDALDFGVEDGNGQSVKWLKSQFTLANGQWMNVYHPETYDVTQYQPRPVSQAPAAVVAPAVPTLTSGGATPFPSATAMIAQANGTLVSDSGGDNGDGTFSTDHYKRLFIPTRFVRELGVKAKDSVFISIEQGKVLLMGSGALVAHQGANGVSTRVVERNGDLRLSSKILTDAGMTDLKFKIENSVDSAGNNVVEITQA